DAVALHPELAAVRERDLLIGCTAAVGKDDLVVRGGMTQVVVHALGAIPVNGAGRGADMPRERDGRRPRVVLDRHRGREGSGGDTRRSADLAGGAVNGEARWQPSGTERLHAGVRGDGDLQADRLPEGGHLDGRRADGERRAGRHLAAARTVAPQALHRERAGGQRDVAVGQVLTPESPGPGALVGVLAAAYAVGTSVDEIDPAKRG